MKWRLLNIGITDLPTLSSIGRAVTEEIINKRSPPTIFIARHKPGVNIGLFQNAADSVDIEKCKELGVSIMRRSAGGGTAYGDLNNIIWVVVGPEELFPSDTMECYRYICGWVITGFEKYLNLKATFAPINDILINGKKISGSGAIRRDGVLNLGGTMLYKVDKEIMFKVLKVDKEKLADKNITRPEERVAGVCEFKDISIEELIEVLAKSLTDGKEYEVGELTEDEKKNVDHLYKTMFGSDEWNFRR
jgi:lipoate-protein ligase A